MCGRAGLGERERMRHQVLAGAQTASEHTLKATPVPRSDRKPTKNEGELGPEYFRDSWGLGSSDQGLVTVQLLPTPTRQAWDLSPAKQDLIPQALLSWHSGSRRKTLEC